MPLVLLSLALLAPPRASFDPNPAHWIAVAVPPKAQAADRSVWEYAASYSKLEWRVVPGKAGVRASLDGDRPSVSAALPTVIKREYGRSDLRVDDGWLFGTNHGEWGGSLSYISADGKRQRKISDDQIVAFFRLSDGIYAVEGLAHLTLSFGSIIRIERSTPKVPWRTSKVATLPTAPYAVAVRSDGTALLVLEDRVSIFRSDAPLRTLLPDAPWWGLYPNSAVLSADETKLYIGMRQFVGELDLRTKALRLLVPTLAHLNRLSAADERSVRYDAARDSNAGKP